MVVMVIASQRRGIGAGAGDGFAAVARPSGQSGGWSQASHIDLVEDIERGFC